ncbi:hypothetical protein L1987_36918 [Smallanthus sonchifolius]|uniref:Uncharacterized protein n=1 Tax=Smallanthus sonchifolius TaxID=185202 RepID=A0ACB9HEI4_9ASTR|nr:hypothetical protein L1987_36918 [Smallanthus sonchifolius]
MKCLVSLNLPELVRDFVLKEEIWKDCLVSTIVWDGQELPYERVVKIRIEGVLIVLRDANTYRKIAEAYGTVIEPFEFSWETLDVSAGTCLVLHGSGKRIDEEMHLIWKNRTFQIWIREVEHQWPPDLNWNQSPVKSGEVGVQETGRMDLEEGEIQTVGGSDTVAEAGFPVPALPVNRGGGRVSNRKPACTAWGNKVGTCGSGFPRLTSYPSQ